AVINPDASDRQVLIFGRVTGLFLVVIGVVLAFALNRVATALTMLLSFSSIMGVIVWGGVLWRRANAAGAWAAFAVMLLIWATLGPIGMLIRGEHWPTWVGQFGSEKVLDSLMFRCLPAGVVALIVGSLLTSPPPRKQVDDFFLLLKTPVGQEQKLLDA